jgi:hypothetical protein
MSAETSYIPLPEPDEIEAQKSLLETMQTANALTMTEPLGEASESIADKVRTRMGIPPGQAANLAVSVGAVKDGEHKPMGERIWVRAEIEEPTQRVIRQMPVARVFEGTILPEEGITSEEAVALNGMVVGLRVAKKLGILSRLDSSLSSINNPYAAMRALSPLKR